MEKKRLSLYLWLFKVNFFISAFTFGGGYVVIPMIRKYFVTEKHLFSEDELMDMQPSPSPPREPSPSIWRCWPDSGPPVFPGLCSAEYPPCCRPSSFCP